MAFRKKAEHILTYQPDILIVLECEHPERLKFTNGISIPNDICWVGENANKGLGVFSYSDFKLKLHDNHNPQFKTVLPISVTKGSYDFNLFAIWANNPKDPDGSYITQIWKAIHYYDALLKGKQTVLMGDFNSNTIWDKPYREGNHSPVVERLEEKNIYSTYHRFYKQVQGREMHPTLYMYRHRDKPYHIDYCFASEDIANKVTDVQIGEYDAWTDMSDHTPLIVTINL